MDQSFYPRWQTGSIFSHPVEGWRRYTSNFYMQPVLALDRVASNLYSLTPHATNKKRACTLKMTSSATKLHVQLSVQHVLHVFVAENTFVSVIFPAVRGDCYFFY